MPNQGRIAEPRAFQLPLESPRGETAASYWILALKARCVRHELRRGHCEPIVYWEKPAPTFSHDALEHFLDAKSVPFRVKKMRQNKNLEPRSDFIAAASALGDALHSGWCDSVATGRHLRQVRREL